MKKAGGAEKRAVCIPVLGKEEMHLFAICNHGDVPPCCAGTAIVVPSRVNMVTAVIILPLVQLQYLFVLLKNRDISI